jgi:1,4-dihydroxy-2-naphthoate octaprenyltransferase
VADTRAIAAGSLRAWVMACRPATLTAALSPVAVGTAVAVSVHGFRSGPALAALFGAICLQIGSNLANDVFDYEKGADTAERLGPTRAAQAGLLTATELKRGMGVAFLLAFTAGIYLTAITGPVIVAIGLGSIASAIAYTGGPFPLGYHGLGDVFVMLFFGFVAVCGTALVQVGSVPLLAWAASVPVGALATAILVVNNVRDCETDVRAGKRTLPVRFGRRVGLVEYAVLLGLAYAVPVLLVAANQASPWALLPLLSAPLAIRLVRRVWRENGPALNATLVLTAKLLFVHSALLAIGLGVGLG